MDDDGTGHEAEILANARTLAYEPVRMVDRALLRTVMNTMDECR